MPPCRRLGFFPPSLRSRARHLAPCSRRKTPRPCSPPGASSAVPPQPVQKQGVEYFVGTWNFKWTGRESAFTPGPRTGTVTFTRLGDTPFLELLASGVADGVGAYKESGTLGWQATRQVVVLHERLWGNVEMLRVGAWSSPISIRFESTPIRVKNQTLRLRRAYGIVSAGSLVSEELSVDGGSFVRLGGGVFTKTSK